MGFRREQRLDLAAQLTRNSRRKTMIRGVMIGGVAVTLGVLAWSASYVAGQQAQTKAVNEVRMHTGRGTLHQLMIAAHVLEQQGDYIQGDAVALGRHALIKSRIAAEFGYEVEAARAVVGSLDPTTPVADGQLAMATMALLGANQVPDYDRVRQHLASANTLEASATTTALPHHRTWLQAHLTIANGGEADIQAAYDDTVEVLNQSPSQTGQIRVSILLSMHLGRWRTALNQLESARVRNEEHLGFAADEALYKVASRQMLAGAASVAEQLLELDEGLSPFDRMHAQLAVAGVRIHGGEREKGMLELREVYPQLPGHDKLGRRVSIELAIVGGDVELASKWINEAKLDPIQAGIWKAAALLQSGDVMGALAVLAELPQEHPKVAVLQGLALVEQGRYDEAQPWLTRAHKLTDGAINVEVGLARTQVQLGDAAAAERKLMGLSESEPFARRVWTGVGEAYLSAVKKMQRDGEDEARLKEHKARAREALERAIKQETNPAQAHMLYGELLDSMRREQTNSPGEAKTAFRTAVEKNPHLPRFRERLAAYLAELGEENRAREELMHVLEHPGTSADSLLLASRLGSSLADSDENWNRQKAVGWEERAMQLGASSIDLKRARIRWNLAVEERGALKRALAEALSLTQADSGDVQSRVLYVRALVKSYDHTEAEAVIRRGLAAVDDAKTGPLFYEWARVEARTGKRGKAGAHARVAWNRLLDDNAAPRDILAAAGLAIRLFVELEKPHAAIGVGRRLSKALPYHSDAWVLRAHAELRGKEAMDARAHALKALHLDEENPRAYAILGRCYMRFGNKAKARESYLAAIKFASNEKLRAEYQTVLQRI